MTYTFLIPDMTCEHCKKRITAAVDAAGGKVDSLDLESKQVILTISRSWDELVALIDEAGYTAQMVE